ncbi:MAG: MBL fold metallo-hydrolase [Gemmatimonadales bacterium]|nr:MAG: MBL fold metallo-hydrolase [Gemmatimonadales bacterium]
MPTLDWPDLRVTTIDAGSLWLDGGAMFGVVPKPLWAQRTEPDDRNRIPLAMRCLLVETADANILIDTGVGAKESEKFHGIYRVDNTGSPTRLEDSLRAAGTKPDSIDIVLNTHLHFDHAGGNTLRAADGSITSAFPNAEYYIRRTEWDFAHLDNERVRASYMLDNFDPLASEKRIRFLDDDTEVVPGVRVLETAGHTPGHQSVLIGTGESRLLYLADLVPTAAHLPLPWVMGYDVEPLVTLESKRRVLARAVEEGWTLAFEHDPMIAWGRPVESSPGRIELVDVNSDPIVRRDE